MPSNIKLPDIPTTQDDMLGWAASISHALDSANRVRQLSTDGDSMGGAIAMGSHKVTGLADGTASGDALHAGQVDGTTIQLNGSDQLEVINGPGVIRQIVNTQTGAVATGATTIPRDDTIPQNTEGDEYMTLAITPTSATNKLIIKALAFGATSANGLATIIALFQDSAANALATGITDVGDVEQNRAQSIYLSHYMTAGTTSATTFKIRIGPSAAATFTFNGHSAGRQFGGTLPSSMTITEIQV